MAKKKGETSVKIYKDWCKGCGICTTFCPSGVLRLNNQGKAEVAHEEECINCGFCEIHCPDFAILVQPKNEIKKKKQASTSDTPPPAVETPTEKDRKTS